MSIPQASCSKNVSRSTVQNLLKNKIRDLTNKKNMTKLLISKFGVNEDSTKISPYYTLTSIITTKFTSTTPDDFLVTSMILTTICLAKKLFFYKK